MKKLLLTEEDYEPCQLSGKEAAAALAGGGLLGCLAGLLFFRHVMGLLLILPVSLLVLRKCAEKKSSAMRRKLRGELRDYLLAVISLLRSGYALENAMTGAEKEIVTMYGEGSMMVREAGRMSRKLMIRIPPERIWQEFGERTALEDGRELARIFAIAKKQGGDYLPVLRTVARTMDARRMVREETETLLAGQKLEYHIMCLIPAGILLYLNLAAPELTARLYEPGGRLFAALLLPVYAAAVLWGDAVLEKSYGRG